MSGTTPTWDLDKHVAARINGASGDVVITLSTNNKNAGVLYFIQDATGGRSLTIGSEDVAVNPDPFALTRVDVSYFFSTQAIFSNYATGGGTLTQLDTPTLNASTLSDTEIGLALTDVDANAVNCSVDRSLTGTSGWVNIYSGSIAGFAAFEDDSLTEATPYYYRAKVTASGFAPSAYATDNATTSAGAVYVIDTFAGGDDSDIAGRTTTSGGGTWETPVANTGTIGIVGGNLKLTSSGSTVAKCVYQANIRNIGVEVIAGAFNEGLYVILAYQDENNYIQVQLKDGNTYEIVGGVPNLLYAGSGSTANAELLGIYLDGANLSIYRQTVLVVAITTVNTALTGTKHGVLCYMGTVQSITHFETLAV